MSGILDNIGWIGCACQRRGFRIRNNAAARMRKIFRYFTGIFRQNAGAMDRGRHWHPASTPGLWWNSATIEISGNKEAPGNSNFGWRCDFRATV